MIQITHEHVQRLVQLEEEVHYNEAPPRGETPFVVVRRDSPVLLSAPHGARTYRNSKKEIWHEEDEYTAGLALLLSELCQVSVIAMVFCSEKYDPNHTESCHYKDELKNIIQAEQTKYVIDLHGAALHSSRLDPEQTIDLGFRSEDESERSMAIGHIEELERLLAAENDGSGPVCFEVRRNKFPAKGRDTITTFVYSLPQDEIQSRVQSVQIEMKPQLRVVRRLPAATLYKSCGPYEAAPKCIIHTLLALANFIEYLKTTV